MLRLLGHYETSTRFFKSLFQLGIILVVLIAPGQRTKLEGSESGDFVSPSEQAQLNTRDAFFDLLR